MSFFASLLEGTANAAERSLGNYQARQNKLEDEARGEENAIARAQRLAELKQRMDEEARQTQMRRTSEQMQQAEAAGEELTAAQRVKELEGAGVGDLSTLTPEQEAAIAKGRGLQYGSALSKLDNQIAAARKGGLHDAEAQLMQSRKETVAAIQAARKEYFDQYRMDQQDRRQDETERHNRAAEERMVKALANKGSSGASVNEKLTTEKSIALRELKLLQDSVPKRQWETHPEMVATRKNISRLNKLLEARNPDDGEDAPAPTKPQSPKGTPAKPNTRPSLDSFYK